MDPIMFVHARTLALLAGHCRLCQTSITAMDHAIGLRTLFHYACRMGDTSSVFAVGLVTTDAACGKAIFRNMCLYASESCMLRGNAICTALFGRFGMTRQRARPMLRTRKFNAGPNKGTVLRKYQCLLQ